MAQLSHCHHQNGNTNYHLLLRKTGQDGQESTKNHQKARLQWIISCCKTGDSVHSVLQQHEPYVYFWSSRFGHIFIKPMISSSLTQNSSMFFVTNKSLHHSKMRAEEIIGTEDCHDIHVLYNFWPNCICTVHDINMHKSIHVCSYVCNYTLYVCTYTVYSIRLLNSTVSHTMTLISATVK